MRESLRASRALVTGIALGGSIFRWAVADVREVHRFSMGDSVTAGSGTTGRVYVKEDRHGIMLGNDLVEFAFDKSRGGKLVGANDKRSRGLKLCSDEVPLQGEWTLEIEDAPSLTASSTSFVRTSRAAPRGAVTVTILVRCPKARLAQMYTLKPKECFLTCRATYENLSSVPTHLKQYQYSLRNLAIGGSIAGNRFLYPPQIFHFMYGDVKDATPDYMGQRYIYGSLQQTTKLMLPYAMIHNDALRECVTIAGANSRTVVRVGAVGGASGCLTCRFDVSKLVAPNQTEGLGTVYLALVRGDWQAGTLTEKAILMKEAGYRAPKSLPKFMKDLIIMADGIPGVGISTFDDLGNVLKDYRDAGITAVWIGGKTWFCPYSMKPESVEGFIPIPQNGYVVPDPVAGGEAGLKRLIAKAHSLGMKLFVWGPTSMAGIALQSEESKTQPDWWVYDKEGKFNNWYAFMAPANPNSPGWRAFFLSNVRKVVRDYGVDGFWLDSSWQDHQLNYQAKDGWYGGPNGAKLSLIGEIVTEAKRINPECVVMAEGGGVETMSLVDAAYVQAFGIWPTIWPDEVQRFVVSQELNRIPGIRPFGQVCQGIGFYAEMSGIPRWLAETYKDSWIAKTFLVSTLDRIPVCFGLNWGIGELLKADRAPVSADSKSNTERLEAQRSQQEFRTWFDCFKRINKIRAEYPEVREGETRFDGVAVSSASVVRYLRCLAGGVSVILLNADKEPQTVTVKITKPEIMKISRKKRYRIANLMTGEAVRKAEGDVEWSGAQIVEGGITISLKGYEGVVWRIRPVVQR